MPKSKPITTAEDLARFLANNNIRERVVFTAQLQGLSFGARASLMSERDLRRLAAGEQVQMKLVIGPLSEDDVTKLARKRPFAIIRR